MQYRYKIPGFFLPMMVAVAAVTATCFTLSAKAQTNLDARILNNIPLGSDPAILPSNQRAQVEPHIARSFSDPNLLIATWQSGRYAQGGGAIGNEYGISRDGGLTWTRDFVPGLTKYLDGSNALHQRASDPVAAISHQNIIFQNSLGLVRDGPGEQTFTLSVITNNSGEFDLPIDVATDQWPSNLLDKNWMAVNSFPGSPTAGRIAVAGDCLLLDPNNPSVWTVSHTFVKISDDQGQSWSEPVFLDETNIGGSQPVFLPNGNLVVGVEVYRPGSSYENRYAVFVSADGGSTFGSPYEVHGMPFGHDIPDIRDGWWLHSMTSDRLRGILYMTWQEKDGLGQSLIQFSRSIDGGHTWSSPVNTRDAIVGVAFNPAISASPDGQQVSILFYDSRGQANSLINHVYLAESFDGGETWEPNVRVSEEPSNFANGPRTSEGYFYGDYHAITPALDFDTPGVAIWIDGRHGDPDPYVAQIARTQGTTFETWRQLRFSAEQLDDLSVSGDAGDPEDDGIPNCLEYILGLEPDEIDPVPFEITGFPGPNFIQISYTALPVVTDKEIFWEKSTNMTSWQQSIPAEVQHQRSDEAAFRDYRVRLDTEEKNMLFFRMGVRPKTSIPALP